MLSPIPVGELDRKTYVGGSRVSAVMGLDPERQGQRKTALTEYLSIIGELEGKPDPERLAFFEWRKEWEVPVVKRLKREFDAQIVSVNQRYRDPDYEFMAAEIDFEWMDETNHPATVENGEIKTCHPLAFSEKQGWGEAGSSDIPVHYAAQCMWGLGVMRRRVCVPVAMAGIDLFTFYRIERDDETIKWLRDGVIDFWVNHVENRIPPDPQNWSDMMQLYAKVNGKPVEIDEGVMRALRDLQEVRVSLTQYKQDEEDLKFTIAEFICKAWGVAPGQEPEDDARLLYKDQEVATWKKGRGAHLDQQRLKKDKPEIVSAYTLPHYFRTIRIKK